jgi:hypothetical protein
MTKKNFLIKIANEKDFESAVKSMRNASFYYKGKPFLFIDSIFFKEDYNKEIIHYDCEKQFSIKNLLNSL